MNTRDEMHEKSFHFHGPRGEINLKAQNLVIFLNIAERIDDETWDFHLHRHDYSRWIRETMKDGELAQRVSDIELQLLKAKESRARVREAVLQKYAL